MKYILILIVSILLSSQIHANDSINVVTSSNLINDYFEINIPEMGTMITGPAKVRIKGIKIPSENGLCANEKTANRSLNNLLHYLLPIGSKIRLTNVGRDITLRTEADFILEDGSNLGDILIQAGLANPVSRANPWCKE